MVRSKMVVSDIHRHRGVRRDPATGAYQPREVHKVTFHACDTQPQDDPTHPLASPAGPLELDVSDLALPEFFEVGKACYLDVSPAE